MPAYLRTALSAAEAAAVARPKNQRFTSDNLRAIDARQAVVDDLERRLADALALFVDPIERRLVIDGVERIAQRAREKEDK